MICAQPECTGEVEDGFCNECGVAPRRVPPEALSVGASRAGTELLLGVATPTSTSVDGRRTTSAGTTATRAARLGAGLVTIAPTPLRDPMTAVMADASVAERRRFCAECNEPVGRSRGDLSGRSEGFCRKCGHPFSFAPKLAAGDLVAGQYEVAGCLAHGGLGWIYLARDQKVSGRWVVLKGLLNATAEDSRAAALAERRFLAEVEHPNIVKIYNFVEHADDGYIVMEFVNGTSLRGMLEARRADNGGNPDPLPPAEAIAYVLEVLPALGYLHDLGLLFCDFKPDNVVQSGGSLKLIDLGGAYRVDDQSSPVYGTIGYQAREIAHTGPTIESDLYTVARSLAVLCTDFRGYQSTYRYSLPPQGDVPLYVRFDSLYRFLERGCAQQPADRFHSAEEMSGQLLGVLREVVAATSGSSAPGPSTQFTGEGRGAVDHPDASALPSPLANTDDPTTALMVSLGAVDADELAALVRQVPERSVELELRLVRTLLEEDRITEAEEVVARIEREHPGDWRTNWYRALASMATDEHDVAARHFTHVLRTVPGELAPKVGLAFAAEAAGDHVGATRWYDVVVQTDPSFVTAVFGLARCRRACGDRRGAVAAYERIPHTSSFHIEAKVAQIEAMLGDQSDDTTMVEILAAAAVAEPLSLEREQRGWLSARILSAALVRLRDDPSSADASARVLGNELTENGVRRGLEATYRQLARLAPSSATRVALVERANLVRPKSLL